VSTAILLMFSVFSVIFLCIFFMVVLSGYMPNNALALFIASCLVQLSLCKIKSTWSMALPFNLQFDEKQNTVLVSG